MRETQEGETGEVPPVADKTSLFRGRPPVSVRFAPGIRLGRRRIVRTVTASYDAPTETVMTACMEAVEATANILPDPAPAVHLTDYGASSIEYTIYCWCTVENYWPAYHSINEKLRDTFAKHNVEMTYDHLNVHILDK